jgi:LacI family transcriptional regulator
VVNEVVGKASVQPSRPPTVRRRVLVLLAWHTTGVFRGITSYARDADWILDSSYERSGALPADWRFDGIIAVLGVHPALDRLVARHRLPLVNIGYTQRGAAPRVFADQCAVARLAAHHFRNRGFRHFAYYERVGGAGDVGRLEAFRRQLAVTGHGLTVLDRRLCPRGVPPTRWLAGELKKLPTPIGVLSEVDDSATEVISAAEEAGLRIPEDIAVLGVGNDELLCPFAPVPLSSVDDNAEGIGRQACLVLDRLMSQRPVATREIPVPPLGVVTRRSTDALAVEHPQVARALQEIRRRYREPLTSEGIIADVPMSRRRLHDAFLRVIGRSAAEEITRLRVEHAKRLLVEGAEKQSYVARESGFRSEARLVLVFTRLTGMSPGQYRKLFNPAFAKVPKVGRPPGRTSR